MPIFGKSKKNKAADGLVDGEQSDMNRPAANGSASAGGAPPEPNHPAKPRPPKLVFHCQQAHGSPTGVISGFTNVKELYGKIAECYDLTQAEILFCTLNTHKPDMSRLLGGQIGLDDFIFAHIKGQKKEVEIEKTEDALGLTITDNGAGYAFIKRIKEGSIMDKIEGVTVGDHIEKIDDKSMVGSRHFEVAKMLKEIPRGQMFTLRLIEPMKSGFTHVAAPSGGSGKKSSYGTGKETLRLRSKGPASVEMADDVVDIATDKINNLLESFMGINDTELAQSIWELGCGLDNPSVFASAVEESDLAEFGFDTNFIFDLWGAISDAKQGRLKKTADFPENF
jgi:hypothetical protein